MIQKQTTIKAVDGGKVKFAVIFLMEFSSLFNVPLAENVVGFLEDRILGASLSIKKVFFCFLGFFV